jgi:CheY-like chemotaxis protein
MSGPWTYRRLVQVPGFGFGTLLDIIDAQRRGAGTPGQPEEDPGFDGEAGRQRAMAVVLERLPASEAEVAQRLVASGVTTDPADLAKLERALRSFARQPPFAVLRRAGLAVVVPTAQLDLAKRIHGLTARALASWGVATVPSIAFQASTEDLDFVARVLAARQGFAWLDARPGWFWFSNSRSPLVLEIQEVLTAVLSADVNDLAQALFRKWPPEVTPPVSVLTELCRQVPSLTVAGTTVRLKPTSMPTKALTEADRQVLAAFDAGGPRIHGWRIPAISLQLGLSPGHLRQLLRSSHLVVEKQPAIFQTVGPARRLTSTSARRLRALVVDDIIDMAQTIANELGVAGFETEVADNGETALERFSDHPADVVVTDLRMSGVDGLDVLDRVKRIDPTVPVVIMTAFGEIEGAVEAMRRGAFHYLPKPFRMDALRELVERACRERAVREKSPDSPSW